MLTWVPGQKVDWYKEGEAGVVTISLFQMRISYRGTKLSPSLNFQFSTIFVKSIQKVKFHHRGKVRIFMMHFVRNKVNMGVIGKPWGGNVGFYDQIRIYCMWKAVQYVLTAFIASEAQ